jgi:hypothetical protein
MALSDPTKLDLAMHLPEDDGRFALVIFDTEPIENSAEREQLLRKKLAGYLRMITSGAVVNSDPRIVGKKAIVQIVCSYPPTSHMLDIHALRDRQDKSIVVPVEVMSLDKFKAQFGLAPG